MVDGVVSRWLLIKVSLDDRSSRWSTLSTYPDAHQYALHGQQPALLGHRPRQQIIIFNLLVDGPHEYYPAGRYPYHPTCGIHIDLLKYR